ncbi:MAG TPA: hypothetical protein VIJ20_07245, partial [Solirubrobacteraceae bacterium]
MDTTVFLQGDGTTEGRIQPTGWTAPDGNWVLCLGSDTPGLTGRLEVGDFIQAAQAGTYPDNVMGLRARTRGPSSAPDQCWWEAAVVIAGVPVLVRRVDVGELYDFADIGWEVAGGTGGSIEFTLTLRGPAGLVVEAELPAFYIDEITFTPTPPLGTRIHNRFPEPSSTGALADANINLDLFPSTTDPSLVTIIVNGEDAYVSGAFTPAYDGPESSVTVTAGGSLRFVIDPLAIWGDREAVAVVLRPPDPLAQLIQWGFTAQRTAGPEIVSVVAQGFEQIRVTYDEAPVAVSATGFGDALNPANYAITRTPGVIAYQPTVVGVAQVSAKVFDIATDAELSHGAPYTLTVQGVTDALGNVTEPWSPGATATFAAWEPPAPAGRSFKLYDFFSDQTRVDDTGDLAALMACLQDCVDLLLYDIDSFPNISNPALAPEQYVDAMLADLANPFTLTLTLTQKRLLVTLLLPIYEKKGTFAGIIDAILLFTGLVVTIDATGWGAELDGVTDILGNGWAGSFPGTFILGSTVGEDPFGFEITVIGTVMPTAAQVAAINQIVSFMQRG